MSNKTTFDNELINTFSKCFKIQFNIFADKIKRENSCRECKEFGKPCKGCDSLSGQKHCLISKMANFSEDGLSNIGSQTINLWLAGKNNYLPNLSLLKKVSLVMGCSLDDFFNESVAVQESNYSFLKNKILGHYGIYQFNQYMNKFSFGVLSIVENPLKAGISVYAILKWRDSNEMVKTVQDLQTGKVGLDDVYKANSYIGKADFDKDGVYINIRNKQVAVNDRIFMVIPNPLNFQDNFALQENKVNYDGKFLGGYGLGTCLNNHIFREALSFPFVFSKYPIEVSTNSDTIKEFVEKFENGEEPSGDFTETLVRAFYNRNLAITQQMEEDLVEYLMDDVE